jgi:hypothetical protein
VVQILEAGHIRGNAGSRVKRGEVGMVTLQTRVYARGITGQQVAHFFIDCTDEDYQRWWEGVHLQFHTVTRTADNIGNLVYFDEYVGKHRLKFRGRITRYEPGKLIEYRMMKGLPLPVWLLLEFEDEPEGVHITHSVKAGYEGRGKIFDPLIRLNLSGAFEKALNEHVGTEFSRLGIMLTCPRGA